MNFDNGGRVGVNIINEEEGARRILDVESMHNLIQSFGAKEGVVKVGVTEAQEARGNVQKKKGRSIGDNELKNIAKVEHERKEKNPRKEKEKEEDLRKKTIDTTMQDALNNTRPFKLRKEMAKRWGKIGERCEVGDGGRKEKLARWDVTTIHSII